MAVFYTVASAGSDSNYLAEWGHWNSQVIPTYLEHRLKDFWMGSD